MDADCRETLGRYVGQPGAINCLELCGYANARVLQGLTDAEIDNVERFVRDACQLMPPEERAGYVGQIFADCPDQFRFPAGTRKGILVAVQTFRERHDKATQTSPPPPPPPLQQQQQPLPHLPDSQAVLGTLPQLDAMSAETQQQLLAAAAACMGLGHPATAAAAAAALCGFPLPPMAPPAGHHAATDLFGQLQQQHQQMLLSSAISKQQQQQQHHSHASSQQSACAKQQQQQLSHHHQPTPVRHRAPPPPQPTLPPPPPPLPQNHDDSSSSAETAAAAGAIASAGSPTAMMMATDASVASALSDSLGGGGGELDVEKLRARSAASVLRLSSKQFEAAQLVEGVDFDIQLEVQVGEDGCRRVSGVYHCHLCKAKRDRTSAVRFSVAKNRYPVVSNIMSHLKMHFAQRPAPAHSPTAEALLGPGAGGPLATGQQPASGCFPSMVPMAGLQQMWAAGLKPPSSVIAAAAAAAAALSGDSSPPGSRDAPPLWASPRFHLHQQQQQNRHSHVTVKTEDSQLLDVSAAE